MKNSCGRSVRCALRQTPRHSSPRRADPRARPSGSASRVTSAESASSTPSHTMSGSASGAVCPSASGASSRKGLNARHRGVMRRSAHRRGSLVLAAGAAAAQVWVELDQGRVGRHGLRWADVDRTGATPQWLEAPPTVAAVLVSHNGARWLPKVLASFAHMFHAPTAWRVVDVASTDGSAELLRESFGAGRITHAPAGTGFGDAVQLALADLPRHRLDLAAARRRRRAARHAVGAARHRDVCARHRGRRAQDPRVALAAPSARGRADDHRRPAPARPGSRPASPMRASTTGRGTSWRSTPPAC